MGKSVKEVAREIPVTQECDVLVCGGGIAGIAAAISAARLGKRVILLEREFALGGMATLGLVTIYLPLCDGEGRQVVFGLGEELLKLSIKYAVEANYPTAWLDGGTLEQRIKDRYLTQFNAHLFALTAEQLLGELGITVLYGTLAAAVAVNGDRIESVIIENKSGRSAINADAVVDCTGDADICALAGADTVLHTGGNGLASWYYHYSRGKVSLKMFGLADVVPGSEHDVNDGERYEAAKVESLGNMRFSGVDGAELSQAVIAAHTKMFEDILRNRASDGDFLPVTMSTIPLVRMSRRLAGEYTLDDSENKLRFEDSIGMTGDWRKRGPVYEIPYRTLYTNRFANLLAAGRCISVTDKMWDITRVIPPCAVTGQAAGVAAALGGDVRSVDVPRLQETLREQGVKLHLEEL